MTGSQRSAGAIRPGVPVRRRQAEDFCESSEPDVPVVGKVGQVRRVPLVFLTRR
jgi:hypothetical protein